MGNIAFLTLFYIWTAQPPDDNRTVVFNLTNLIQIWRQTLNRTHFVEMFCALTETGCKVTANSQRIDSFTFVTASSLLRLIQPHFVAVACSVNYGKVTPSITEQRHRQRQSPACYYSES
ncbi:hypothetical protein T06_495 [Trichinella sp. T6]|nr:hypothetical protein T06_495 [Trichinella sp. T6]